MKYKYPFLVLTLTVLLVPALSQASKTTYIVTDRRFNFVKRVELDKDEIKERKITQPYTFTDLQMRDMLAGIKCNKQLVVEKQVQDQEVYNQPALDFLVPYLVKAFKEAQPNEEVVFSYLASKGMILAQDHRLTIASAWVDGGVLHLKFRKLMAKIASVNEKMSDISQTINRAQGVRVSLDAGPGQQFGNTTDELLLTVPDANAVVDNRPQTTDHEPKTNNVLRATSSEQRLPASSLAGATAAPSIERRLQQLESLKKQGLVNDEEYKQKRQEILKQL